ncbi:MAG: hypothetical protein QXP98_05730 [Thermoproteus sp.]
MELARYLLIRFLTEVLGFRLESERDDYLSLYDGGNKVIVRTYFTDIYEESEIYKKINELLQQDCDKAFLAVLKDALPFIDPKHLKSIGVGLISVDTPKGLDGVEIKIQARARPRQIQQAVDISKILSAVNAAVAEALSRESKRLEEEIMKKVRSYVDKALEEFRRELSTRWPAQQAQPPQPTQQAPQQVASIAENEWVRLLRRKGQ